MYRVKVKIGQVESKKIIKLEGFTKHYPKVGENFNMTTDKDEHVIEFGKVYNIRTFGDMMLVQTEYIVAEVWLTDWGRNAERKVIPFIKDHKTLVIQDGKIYGRRRKGATASGTFSRLNTLIKLLKEDEAFYRQKPKQKLTLVKEGHHNV